MKGRNPYAIGLLVAGCILASTALALVLGLSDLTDYTSYDVATVLGTTAGITICGLGALVSFAGAAVIAGVRWTPGPRPASARPAPTVDQRSSTAPTRD
jgi:hypothetical protein